MNADDYLLLSGIHHIAVCERQWALIHIEQLWQENERTIEGTHLHKRADNPFLDESRGDIRSVRGMPIVSHRLRLRGVADVVEFYSATKHEEGVTCFLPNRRGSWRPVPVEYKRGVPKSDDRDTVQLCAQAMALEEMFGVFIREGFMFYGERRRRQRVLLDEGLREHTNCLSEQMHDLFHLGITPRASKGKHCSRCSLVELCLPRLGTKHRSVASYLEQALREEKDECENS